MKLLARNKKALFNYEVLHQFEAGIVLSGWEVKSCKAGRVSLKESFVTLRGDEAWLLNTHINKWVQMGAEGNRVGIETHERKLLLNRAELNRLKGGIAEKGNTIVVLDMHLSGNRVKLSIALARGKKQYDKRAKLKEKDQKRELERDLKQFKI